MLMGELTLRQSGLSVKIIVFKNGTLGFVEMEMKAAGLVETSVTLDNPDFAAMARAIGLHGVRITDPREVRRASATSWRIRDQRCSMPPKTTLEQMKGFTLYVAKAIISGRRIRWSNRERPMRAC